MLISGKKKNEKLFIDVIDDGKKKRLQPKTSIKILGVYIDEKLNWSKQIQEVNKKAKYAARNLQRVNMLIPIKSRLLLYKSLVASHLKYADTVWAGGNARDINKLQRTQNLAVKSILGMRRRESATEAMKAANLLPIRDKMKIHQAVYIHKALHDKLPTQICEQYKQLKPNTEYRSAEQNKLTIASHKTEKFKNSTLYRTVQTWNSIPCETKKIKNSSTFKNNYQKHLQSLFKM